MIGWNLESTHEWRLLLGDAKLGRTPVCWKHSIYIYIYTHTIFRFQNEVGTPGEWARHGMFYASSDLAKQVLATLENEVWPHLQFRDVPNTIWLWLTVRHGKSRKQMEVLMGKSSINGPFSMVMLNNQRVHSVVHMFDETKRCVVGFLCNSVVA